MHDERWRCQLRGRRRTAGNNTTTNQARWVPWSDKRWMCQLKDLAMRRGQQIRGAADKRCNRDSLLRVVLLCVTSFTCFWSTCWGIVRFWWEGKTRNLFLQEHSPCKKEFLESYPWKKRNLERNSFFWQELGSNSTGFLELESQKKRNAKRNAQPSSAISNQLEAGLIMVRAIKSICKCRDQ